MPSPVGKPGRSNSIRMPPRLCNSSAAEVTVLENFGHRGYRLRAGGPGLTPPWPKMENGPSPERRRVSQLQGFQASVIATTLTFNSIFESFFQKSGHEGFCTLGCPFSAQSGGFGDSGCPWIEFHRLLVVFDHVGQRSGRTVVKQGGRPVWRIALRRPAFSHCAILSSPGVGSLYQMVMRFAIPYPASLLSRVFPILVAGRAPTVMERLIKKGKGPAPLAKNPVSHWRENGRVHSIPGQAWFPAPRSRE